MRFAEPNVKLVSITPNAELLIESAGRLCYRSEGKSDGTKAGAEKFIRNVLWAKNHTSVFEHASATVLIVTDRGVSHENVRHRLASYSQESTRYCNYADDRFGNEITLIPMMDNLTAEQIERRMRLFAQIEEAYLAEIAEGIAPQQARDLLPTCLKTEYYFTANFREWCHFLNLRYLGTTGKPHPQMVKVATQAAYLLAKACPVIFERFVEKAEMAKQMGVA